MSLTYFQIPGPLGYTLERGSNPQPISLPTPDRSILPIVDRGESSPVQPLSGPQVLGLVERLQGRSAIADSRNLPQARSFERAKGSEGGTPDVARQSFKAKGAVGDKPEAPRGPTTKASPFNPALLDAALKAGVRVRLFKKGESKNTPATDLKLAEMLPSAAVLAAGVIPIGLLPPAQLPGPPMSGPLNLPGPFSPNAFAPGSFVEPPPAIAPGAGGSLPISLPAALTAGSVVFFFGSVFASDTRIKQADPSRIYPLIDKFTRAVREAAEKLNKATFNNDWSEIATSQPALWARILGLIDTDPFTGFKLLKIAFGRTIEDMVAARVLVDPELDDAIDRVGGANQPDFRGTGDLQDFTLEITTEDGLQTHLDRKENPNYGRFLLVFTYERWFTESLNKDPRK